MFELLEPRNLLAGDVSAYQAGGTLFIIGDDDDNTVSISHAGEDTYAIQGRLDWESSAATTINGEDTTSTPVLISGVTGAFFINMMNGDNRLAINSAVVNGSLGIYLGSGNDLVLVGSAAPVTVRAEMAVVLGEGGDQYAEVKTHVGSFAEISGGAGSDSISLVMSTVANSMRIDGDEGFDAITVSHAAVGGMFLVRGGSDGDLLQCEYSAFGQSVAIWGEAGADHVVMTCCRFGGALLLEMGDDFGLAILTGCLSENTAVIVARGPAQVMVINSGLNRLEVVTSSFRDSFDLAGSVLDELYAALGDSDDTLYIFNTRLNVAGSVDGGSGVNDLFQWGNLLSNLHAVNLAARR
jgi:hypothetical protein